MAISEFFQVWALPGLPLPRPLELAGNLTIKAATRDRPGAEPLVLTLVQLEASRASTDEPTEPYFRRVGKVLARLSFGLLQPFSIFSARVVPKGLKQGDQVSEILFPGEPPGISLTENRIGFRKTVTLDPTFLSGELTAEVEVAISWFLAGNAGLNSVQQVLCHWNGLESLAPSLVGYWRCTECEREVCQCPHCGAATAGPKTVQTIRNFLRNDLGVSRTEFESLYGLRCRVVHGGLGHDPDGLQAASDKAARIQELLLLGIKRALGWPAEQPPIIRSQGITLVGVPGLVAEGVVQRDDFYDTPGVSSGWH